MENDITEKLRGIFAPIATPFDGNEDIDADALAHNLALYEKSALRGLLVLGSNGENKSLDEGEKMSVLETVLENIGEKRTVIVGVMYECARQAESFLDRIAVLGADFALVQSPSYFKKSLNDEALYRYFSNLADRASVPVLLYNSPGFNGVTLSLDLIEKLSQHPNIVGMKDSTPGCELNVMRLNSENFRVMAGSITKLSDFSRHKSIGGTVSLADYAPDQAVELHRRIVEDGPPACVDFNCKVVEANKCISGRFGVAGVKAAMNLTGFRAGIPRRPLLPLEAEQIEMVKSALVDLGALRR